MRLLGAALALIPLAFGLIRAMTTGSDLRYLWLALVVGGASALTLRYTRSARPLARVALSVVVSGLSGVACALAQGAASLPAVAVVVAGFAVCSGVGLSIALRDA